MANATAWIQAFRLRTLPLALSSIALGGFAAWHRGSFQLTVSLLAALTTLLLQILSNLANDYGDSKKGTDNDNRVGPSRAVQSGAISPASMKRAVIFFSGLSLLSGILLLLAAFGTSGKLYLLLSFFLLGVGAILAAIRYTIGENPYGYAGFGDLFVFLFFGLVAVAGTFFLNGLKLEFDVFYLAAAMGLLSTGVLNLNNMRDIENDRASGKNSLVVKMGSSRALIYHVGLITLALLSFLLYSWSHFQSWSQLSYVAVYPLFFIHIRRVVMEKEARKLDPRLKELALLSLLLVVVFGLSLNLTL